MKKTNTNLHSDQMESKYRSKMLKEKKCHLQWHANDQGVATLGTRQDREEKWNTLKSSHKFPIIHNSEIMNKNLFTGVSKHNTPQVNGKGHCDFIAIVINLFANCLCKQLAEANNRKERLL